MQAYRRLGACDLEIAHTCYAILGFQECATQSRDCANSQIALTQFVVSWGAEFASIVIELVIGILLSPTNNYMPFVQQYKLHQLL